MKITNSFFNKKILEIKLDIHKDKRGFFLESYNKKKLNDIGIKKSFIQDNFSFSIKKYTFRGIHTQLRPFSQAKILRVIKGSILDYVVDLRPNSVTFGKYIKILLNDKNLSCIFIPEGFGHGFLTLSNNTLINYKVTKHYSAKHSVSISHLDKTIKLDLSIAKEKRITISKNDLKGISLIKFKNISIKKI